jgi:hypothetical protein
MDGAIWRRSFSAGAWTAWQSLGGRFAAAAGAATCASGTFSVFGVGLDHAIWLRSFNGSAWSSWTMVGDDRTSRPGAVCHSGIPATDVSVRGIDGALWLVEIR